MKPAKQTENRRIRDLGRNPEVKIAVGKISPQNENRVFCSKSNAAFNGNHPAKKSEVSKYS